MPIVYHITIEAAQKENIFHIEWTDTENVAYSFEQSSAGIDPEEVDWLWNDRGNQPRIGRKLFRFLNGDEHHLERALKEAENYGKPLLLHLSTCPETNHWPFELLAQGNTFLLPRRLHLVRSISHKKTAAKLLPETRRLRLLFMVCSPSGVEPELDFETEEETIFNITEDLAIDMEVEDTGSLEGLREKLEKQEYDIVHLSGYAGIDEKEQPFLITENETGYRVDVSANELWRKALHINPPRLLFLSGGRSGETPGTIEGSFARQLVEKSHVPAVLGWGRSVSDGEATEAAKMIYQELSRGKTIIDAVQRARYQLTVSFPSIIKPAWPQLKLFSSGDSLGSLVEKEQRWQPQTRFMRHAYLKNSEVKVLKEGFVGRRRQLQQSIRGLTGEFQKVGLLILGPGGLGKSSLAGKLCERFNRHTLIIVRGTFDAITVASALKDAFIIKQDEVGKDILSQKKEMPDKLTKLCSTSFKEANYLFVLDDFEQNLAGAEEWKPHRLLPEAEVLLRTLLACLPDCGKRTQIIITCRYDFPLIIEHTDLVNERLEKVWLAGFQKPGQRKKAQSLKHISHYKDRSVARRLIASGHGNPRLMERLDVLVGEMPAAEVQQLLDAVQTQKEDFIKEHVIRELLRLGGDCLTVFLRWFSIFRRPVMGEGAHLTAKEAGVENWKELLHTGIRLSLVEYDQVRRRYQVIPLLRDELLENLQALSTCHKAAFAYYLSLYNSCDYFDPLSAKELIYHALGCGDEDAASKHGGDLMVYLRKHLAFRESRRVGKWILTKKKKELSTENDSFLLNEFAHTIHDLGEHYEAIDYFEQALVITRTVNGEKHEKVATRLNNLGAVWAGLGNHQQAVECFKEVLTILKNIHGDTHTNVAGALNNLGLQCDASGQYREAIDYYLRALDTWKSIYGDTHHKIAYAASNLGAAWQALSEYDRATDYFQQALEIDRKLYSDNHPDISRDLNNLGEVNRKLGRFQKAIDYFHHSLTVDVAIFGNKHHKVARSVNNLGAAWQECGDLKKAAEYFEKAIEIDREFYGEESLYVAIGLNNLGGVRMELGEHAEAAKNYEQAFTLFKKVCGEMHPAAATVANNIGKMQVELGHPQEAIYYYEQALTIFKKKYGEKHSDIGGVLTNLGAAWTRLGKTEKAIPFCRQALDIMESVYGREHPDVATALSNLGSTYFHGGQPEKAKEYFERAHKIFYKFYGPQHSSTKSVFKFLKRCPGS